MFDWMVWTTPVAVFFTCIGLMLAGMTVWERKSPTTMRKGFLPIATAKSTTGEYTFAIFAVVTMALLISWLMAVTAAPFIGKYLLKETRGGGHEVFDTRFYRGLRALIELSLVRVEV